MEGAKNGYGHPDMKTQIQNRRGRAFGLLDVLVIIALLVILGILAFLLLLPVLIGGAKRPTQRINCASNLRQIGLAFRIWEGDNNNQYPMAVSVTNGGGMELIETGNPIACLQCASNEMSTTKILVCPADSGRTFATNWNELDGSHISYFLNMDASNGADLGCILAGDDNIAINGSPVKSGLWDVSSNALIGWAPGRHGSVYRPHFWSSPKTNGFGNFVFADGSIRQGYSMGLQQAFQGTGLATNRIAIP
jgi:hypothetical protein